MWIQQGAGQTFTWRYGKITITNQPHSIDPNQITVLSQPFSAQNSNNLLLDLNSQNQKCMSTVETILNFFVQKRAVKNTVVNLKGGGMLLDVGGFACSIYMRGMSNVTYIPTTLLAMVDATVGGKTGINFGHAKNLVGATKHPKHIIIDTSTLLTLSDRQFNNGMAEVIKMAATYDQGFFQYLESIDLNSLRKRENLQSLKYIIKRSLEIKVSVVEKDQFEAHERKWLNFGHTIGHAIQLADGHHLLHGQCVAIGMIAVLELSRHLSLFNKLNALTRLKKLLHSIHLPTSIPKQVNLAEMMNLMLKDKKKSDSSDVIEFVLIKDIGCPEDAVNKISMSRIAEYFASEIEIKSIGSLNPEVNEQFLFPSSKSISLRFAYLAALSMVKFHKTTTVVNFLHSDDTKWMLYSLARLGFQIQHNEEKRKLVIKGYEAKEKAVLNIGNSGITARIILPLCASLRGEWRIECHPRMSERPNQQIIKLCQQQFDCQFTYLQKQFSFPLIIKTKQTNFGLKDSCIPIDGNESSQFITSVMIYGSFFHDQIEIHTRGGTLVSQSYLEMTAQCLEYFNIRTKFDAGKIHLASSECRHVSELSVEADLSSLSYPYVFSKLHGIPLPQLPAKSMQGDLLFYSYLESICRSCGKQVRLDFNNCTDTFMTLAVFVVGSAVQQSSIDSITIYNIANQRIKQSNRIHLIIKNLRRVGVRVEEYENEIKIWKKFVIPEDKMFYFETGNDHRLAMSLSVMATYLKKLHPEKRFIIDDKSAVQKTFPQFWGYLQQAGVQTAPFLETNYLPKSPKLKGVILIGDRGSGKTDLGRLLAQNLQVPFIDLDHLITEEIKSIGEHSISHLVGRHGWRRFRQIQSRLLQEVLGSQQPDQFVLATGAGIVEDKLNQATLERDERVKIYLERDFEDLRIEHTSHRPEIIDYREVSKRRAPLYQALADIIVNIPTRLSKEQEFKLLLKNINKFFRAKPLKEGIILTTNEVPHSLQQFQIDPNDLSSIELRLDALIENKMELKQIRRRVSMFQHQNAIDTILTLRTKQQYGFYTANYLSMQNQIRKMPTQFLDHQFLFPIKYEYNPAKLILSYHGERVPTIQKLIALKDFHGIKKLCLKGSQTKWEEYSKNLGDHSICINLNEPISRLHNRYQFAVLNEPSQNLTGIMTVNQMKVLKAMKKVLLRK